MSEVLWSDEHKQRLVKIVGEDDSLSILAITQDVALIDAIREHVIDLEFPLRLRQPTDVRHLLEDSKGEFDADEARRLHAGLARASALAELVDELLRSEPYVSLTMEQFGRLQRESTWLR